MDVVTIEVFQAQFGGSDFQVLELFEGVRGVAKARVYGSVTNFPEYVKWLEGTMMSEEGVERVFEEEDETAKEAMVTDYDIWIVSMGIFASDWTNGIKAWRSVKFVDCWISSLHQMTTRSRRYFPPGKICCFHLPFWSSGHAHFR